MNKKILIIGSTGKLGSKLLNFCFDKNINIHCITGYNNSKKLINYSNKYNIPSAYLLSLQDHKIKFIKHFKKVNYKLIYFLDHGSKSIEILLEIFKTQKKSIIAIANKEMLIAAGKIVLNQFEKTGNKFIPLDSEHFSLLNNKINNQLIKKIYITASGGPLYFKKNINLNQVLMRQVLSHPKWQMGINNLIDSSNFINKVLEIFELSSIFKIELEKIDFVVSPEAYIHSIVLFYDSTLTYNCFVNNMLITLVKPLSYIYDIDLNLNSINLKNNHQFYFEPYKDKRFAIFKHIKKIKKLSHKQQINFMYLNNIAQKLYLKNQIKYKEILPFILSNLDFNDKSSYLTSISKILIYLHSLDRKYNHYNA